MALSTYASTAASGILTLKSLSRARSFVAYMEDMQLISLQGPSFDLESMWSRFLISPLYGLASMPSDSSNIS